LWEQVFQAVMCVLRAVLCRTQHGTRDDLVARIMNSAALIKQEHQDNLRNAKRTVAKIVEKCTEVDSGIFEHLL
jgi:hypothetical protein